MTNPDYTHLTLIVDRSGSMSAVRADAQGAINQLFEDQRKLPGKLTVTLIDFDTQYDEIYRMCDITDVPDYTLAPRGSTALLDAVGRAIVSTGEDLSALSEDERPGNVLIQIITDGEENSSQEWTLEQIQERIKEQRENYGWIFAFFGADEHAWYGQRMGTNTVSSYRGDRVGTVAMAATASASLGTLRSTGNYDAPEKIDSDAPSS